MVDAQERQWVDRPADQRRRARLVQQALRTYTADEAADDAVTQVMARVPRHFFVPPGFAAAAYDDRPLAIGAEQTISQPSLVARMLRLLQLQPGHEVFDIGAGSGYAAYCCAQLTAPNGMVIGVERQGVLARQSAQVLQQLPAAPLRLQHGDALNVLSEYPDGFDRIHAGCVLETIPSALLAALKPQGRMVIPVGKPDAAQLMVYARDAAGVVTGQAHGDVRFVPFIAGLEG